MAGGSSLKQATGGESVLGGPGGGGIGKLLGGLSTGGILTGVGGIASMLENILGPSQEDLAQNSFNQKGLDFLAQGGGVKNAQNIAAGEKANAIAKYLGVDGLYSDTTKDARAGLGPGGGFGVTKGIDDFREENKGEFVEQSLGSKIAGGIAGMLG